MKQQEFKVGDEVRLRKGLKFNKQYGGLIFIKEMGFNGFRTILDVGINPKHFTIGLFYYPPEMLILKAPSK